MIKYKLITGDKFSIYSLEKNGKRPLEEFLFDLKKVNLKEYIKIMELIEYIANHGIPSNKEKFKDLNGIDNLFEMKAHQVRIFCFFHGARIIITTHGFLKKSQKTPKEEINRAIELKKEYYKRSEI